MPVLISRLSSCGAILVVAASCAGARGSITFGHLQYPVSMSHYMEKPAGHPLPPSDLEVVGRMEHETRFWGMLYSSLRLTGTEDISEVINGELRKTGGDGLTGLTVTSDGCWWNTAPILNWLPFWPGCVDVSIVGDIVRLKPRPEASAPPPPRADLRDNEPNTAPPSPAESKQPEPSNDEGQQATDADGSPDEGKADEGSNAPSP